MIYFGGIDNGKSGGISIIDQSGVLVYSEPTPLAGRRGEKDYDYKKIADLFKSYMRVSGGQFYVALENGSNSFAPKNSKSSIAGTFFSYGFYTGLLVILGAYVLPVAPKRWQSDLMGNVAPGSTKKVAALICAELYPDADLRENDRCRVPHSGKVDSILLAHYAFKNYMDEHSPR